MWSRDAASLGVRLGVVSLVMRVHCCLASVEAHI
jgi:hypothetical protein